MPKIKKFNYEFFVTGEKYNKKQLVSKKSPAVIILEIFEKIRYPKNV